MKISVIGDEVAYSIDEQIEHLLSEGINNIEIRKVNGTNIVDCSNDVIFEIISSIKRYNMKVSMIATDIGKKKRSITQVYNSFKKGLAIANDLDCNYIRIFSNLADSENENLNCIKELIVLASEYNITIALENEVNTWAYHPDYCENLINKTENRLGLLYDIGNFYKCGFYMEDTYNKLFNSIVYIHMKDMSKRNYNWTYVGNGDVNAKKFLNILKNSDYQGYISLEPHFCISNFGERYYTFSKYIRNFKKLLSELGVWI